MLTPFLPRATPRGRRWGERKKVKADKRTYFLVPSFLLSQWAILDIRFAAIGRQHLPEAPQAGFADP